MPSGQCFKILVIDLIRQAAHLSYGYRRIQNIKFYRLALKILEIQKIKTKLTGLSIFINKNRQLKFELQALLCLHFVYIIFCTLFSTVCMLTITLLNAMICCITLICIIKPVSVYNGLLQCIITVKPQCVKNQCHYHQKVDY